MESAGWLPWFVKVLNSACLLHACGRRKTCRQCRGNRTGRRRLYKGGFLRVDRVGIIGTEAELFQRPCIRQQFRLPALGGLVLRHGRLGSLVPLAVGFAGQIVLADESLLNLCNPARLHHLLAARAASFVLSFVCSVSSLASLCLCRMRLCGMCLRHMCLCGMRLCRVRLRTVCLGRM